MPYILPQRKSPRARWHDYTGADYFVTFCTKNRELYFGDVVNGQMVLSEIGKWAKTQIEQTAIIRQNEVTIPIYVVMPNHIHLIVVCSNRVGGHTPGSGHTPDGGHTRFGGRTQCVPTDPTEPCRDTSNVSELNASESNASANNTPNNATDARDLTDARGTADARGASLQFGPQSGNLPSVVRGIKSAVTKYAIEHDIPFAWQPRYHDHIIRNQAEMNRIADYIENNPMRWETDKFYKKR